MIVLLCFGFFGTRARAGFAWTANPANGHKYAVTASALTWQVAEAVAVSHGGHLATVRNAAENHWLSGTFPGSNWIGFTDEAQVGTWVWISGEPVTFTAWAGTAPNRHGGTGNHAANNQHLPGGWADLPGDVLVPGIIEVVPESVAYTFTFPLIFIGLAAAGGLIRRWY